MRRALISMAILWCLGSLGVAVGLAASTTPAFADHRLALVIGNSAYKQAPVLSNPVNDATDLAASLERLGFDVLRGTDLDYQGMREIVRRFSDKLPGADVALFFYAGHGLQVAGKNYLAPVDARINTQADLDFGTIDLDLVVRAMEAEKRTNIIFLDACRDNPLAQRLAERMGTRSTAIGRGLTQTRAGVGTLIAYSTQPDNVAQDGDGRNSPFTAALLKTIERPGLPLGEVMIDVRNDVLAATKGQQVPWDHSSLTGQFYFIPPPATAPAKTAESGDSLEITFWNSIKDSRNPQLFEAYLKRYPTGAFAEIARINLAQFKVASAQPMRGMSGSAPLSDPGMIREVRERLYELNFDPDLPNGKDAMPAAIAEFETQNNLPKSGKATEGLLDRLRELGGLKPWGAIVFSSNAGKWGMAWGHTSRKEAVADARSKCSAAQCSAEVSFFGTSCGAFASSGAKWAMVTRDQLQKAKDAALDDCSKSGKSCRIVGAICADGAKSE